MFLPLPNLDDRRWSDLVEEGRSLISLYAPEWTDHNIHDPGITLMELLAWIAEMDLYHLNQIPGQHKRKFLSLVGIRPEPPRPSQTVISFKLGNQDTSLPLPETLEVEGKDPFGQRTPFRILNTINVVSGALTTIQCKDQKGFSDLTARWRRGEPIFVFGEDPRPGAEFYLGFSQALPQKIQVSLFFTFLDLRDGEEERLRIIREIQSQREACRPPESLLTCKEERDTLRKEENDSAVGKGSGEMLVHHSVHTVWEFLAGGGRWQVLDPASDSVEDETRSFTLNGRLLLKIPEAMIPGRMGAVNDELYYIRCRFAYGTYDDTPVVQNLAMNGVLAEQAVSVGDFTLTIPDSPGIETKLLGLGTGSPDQQISLTEKPVHQSSFRLFTIEDDNWFEWTLRPDFDASGRDEFHFLLDPTRGVVTFGDGEQGRVVPLNVRIVASYHATRAEEGNLGANTINKLATSVHNKALLADFDTDKKQLLEWITNPLPAVGGSAAETLPHAAGRAIELIERPHRAVTLADCETLAMQTPGVRLARVSARANLYPGIPCFKAPGIITVIILPFLPDDKPMPGRGLQQTVAAYLARRRVIGTRIEVVGPTYLKISVLANVQACKGTNKNDLQKRIQENLNRFFHPIKGGPDEKGWPFGRDIYRSEVLQVIDETPGVDHIILLELIPERGAPQCGNICLGPIGLVAVGQHQIEVI